VANQCFVLGVQRQQAKETELRHELVELQGRERTSQSEVESKNQDIDSVQRELARLKGGPARARLRAGQLVCTNQLQRTVELQTSALGLQERPDTSEPS
jgi:ribosomal protein L29